MSEQMSKKIERLELAIRQGSANAILDQDKNALAQNEKSYRIKNRIGDRYESTQNIQGEKNHV